MPFICAARCLKSIFKVRNRSFSWSAHCVLWLPKISRYGGFLGSCDRLTDRSKHADGISGRLDQGKVTQPLFGGLADTRFTG
jgi:hypothetical protein